MKANQILALAGISMLAMSNSCEKEGNVSPNPELTKGRVVRYETTYDTNLKNPRTRWIIDISPLSLAGSGGKLYQKAKTFTLPDTASYKAGTTLLFHYTLVPYAQQTPWKSSPELLGVPAAPYETELLPEITLSGLQQSIVK